MQPDISCRHIGPAIRSAFYQHGYLVLRQAWNQAEIRSLHAVATQVREYTNRQLPNGTRYWHNDRSCKRPEVPHPEDYSWGINDITRGEFFHPLMINSLGHQPIDAVLNYLLQQPRAWGLKLLWAPKRSHYNLQWHRDLSGGWEKLVPFKPASNDHVQFNAALAPDESFVVLAGSHRRALSDSEREIITHDRTADIPGQIRVSLEPGDVVFMDAHALHRGSCAAGAPRLSLHYSCQTQDIPLAPWGHATHFRELCSETFRSRLSPRTRPYYQRLSEAEIEHNQCAWLARAAKRAGYTGPIPEARIVYANN